MRLVVGLGNPGVRYRDSWHNLGAMVVERLADRWSVGFKPGKGSYFAAEHRDTFAKTTLMLPTSFMNRSGDPVGNWVRYYKVDTEQILIIYDDHDLPLGKIRLRQQGSSGGHNGLEDIICRLSTDKIPRIKIGIRTDMEKSNLSSQVLSPISKKLQETVGIVIVHVAECVEMIRKDGFDVAANRYNGMELI
jgi:peptidyl-tRNA hydrolase, PTH1 family